MSLEKESTCDDSKPIAPHRQATSLWKDTARSTDERVDLLLAEMTLEEKVAQLGLSLIHI